MKCEKCGNKIEHNSYKKVKGKYYCLECNPTIKAKFTATALEKTINVANIDFSELQKALVTPTEKADINLDEVEKVVSKMQTEKAAEEIKKYGLVGFTEKPKRKRKVGKHKKTSTKRGD